VQAAQLANQIMPGSQEQMVRIGQHDLGAGVAQIAGRQALYRALARHRHEGRRVYRAVRRAHPPEAGASVRLDELESKRRHVFRG